MTTTEPVTEEEIKPDTEPEGVVADEAPEPEPVEGTPDERDDARGRGRQCNAAIQQVLAQYHCRIMPILLQPEPVGNDGNKMMVTADVQIVPQPLE